MLKFVRKSLLLIVFCLVFVGNSFGQPNPHPITIGGINIKITPTILSLTDTEIDLLLDITATPNGSSINTGFGGEKLDGKLTFDVNLLSVIGTECGLETARISSIADQEFATEQMWLDHLAANKNWNIYFRTLEGVTVTSTNFTSNGNYKYTTLQVVIDNITVFSDNIAPPESAHQTLASAAVELGQVSTPCVGIPLEVPDCSYCEWASVGAEIAEVTYEGSTVITRCISDWYDTANRFETLTNPNDCFSGKTTSTTPTQAIHIYPNPANHFIQIEHISTDATISIYDMTGKLLVTPTNNNRLDTSDWLSGLYIIQVTDKGQTTQHKIQVTH